VTVSRDRVPRDTGHGTQSHNRVRDTVGHGGTQSSKPWVSSYRKRKTNRSARDIKKAARADGIAERTLHRARVKLGVTAKRAGFGQPGIWSLDAQSCHSRSQSCQSCQHSEPGTSGTTEATPGTTALPIPTEEGPQ